MSIEKLKAELQAYIDAREKASQGKWTKCLVRWVDTEFMLDNGEMQKVTTSGIVPECENSKFACLAANKSAHIASLLLEAIEVIELCHRRMSKTAWIEDECFEKADAFLAKLTKESE